MREYSNMGSLQRMFVKVTNEFVSAVGNSPPFWTNLPFHEFPKIVKHELWLKCVGNS
jgi:hypothetical protein